MEAHLLGFGAILIQSIFIRSISSSWTPLTNVLSLQLRSLAYIFLRWFPASHLATAIPFLFLVYTIVWARNKSDNYPSLTVEHLDQDSDEQDSKILLQIPSSSAPSTSNSTSKDRNHLPSSSQATKSNEIKKNEAKPLEPSRDHDLQKLSWETDPLLPPINQSGAGRKTALLRTKRKIKYRSESNDDRPNWIQSALNLVLGVTYREKSTSKTNRIIFLTNLILTLFSLDSTFRTSLFYGSEDLSFNRVGAVGETWVKVHVRIPPNYEDFDQDFNGFSHRTIGAQLVYRPMKPIGNWTWGPSLITSDSSDWTSVGKIDNLSPGQTYEYRLNSLEDSNQPHALFETVGHFKTAPDTTWLSNPKADGGSFTFAYSSCIKPGFPYNPFRQPLHNDGAEQLSDFVKKLKLDFVLLLGDFIYADSPIYLGNSIRHYWKKYRQTFASDGWKKVMQFTSTIHIYDDHEIYNDWAGDGNDTNEIFEPANRAYTDYLGSGNYEGPGSGKNYYWFRYGDAGFFVWDCRRYRSPNQKLDDHSKTMLGIEQKNTFISWLTAVNSTVTFKFVISSTPFMSLWSGPDGGIDTWAGFLTERNELMDYMEFIPNLIVLSGDRHEFAAGVIRETVYEFSTSPLNQFWLPIRTLRPENGLGKTGEDKLVKYIPNGIHKFSTLNVDCRDPQRPTVNFKLYIDEKLSWELKYLGKPVKEEAKQLGQILPSWEQLLNFLKPIRWFSDTVTNTIASNHHHHDRDDSGSFLTSDFHSDDSFSRSHFQADQVL